MSYDKLVKALRCKGLSKKCDSCGYGYHISPDSECNDACHFEQIAEDAAAAIEALQAEVKRLEPKRGDAVEVVRYKDCKWSISCGYISTRSYAEWKDWFCADGEGGN